MTTALLLKCVTMGGGGVKNCLKFRDNIYGRPLNYLYIYIYINRLNCLKGVNISYSILFQHKCIFSLIYVKKSFLRSCFVFRSNLQESVGRNEPHLDLISFWHLSPLQIFLTVWLRTCETTFLLLIAIQKFIY